MEQTIKGIGWETISGWENNQEDRGLYYNGELISSFCSKEDCNNSSYNIYIYANLKDSKCYLKLGKMKDSVIERYKGYQDMENPAERVIALYNTDLGDEIIHKELQITQDIIGAYSWQKASDNNHTDENYLMHNVNSIVKFTDEVERIINSKNAKVKDQPIYEDIKNLVIDVFSQVSDNNKFWNILNLCTRWGKTRTNLSLCEIFNYQHRISIMASYVGTVRNSYKQAIETIKCYNDYFRFYDLNNDLNIDEIISFIEENENNHIMFYLALTGDTDNTYMNRTKIFNNKKLKKYTKLLFIEEADFGAHCEEQINKIKKLKNYNIVHTFITTGTGFDKLQKFIGKEDYNIWVKDYLYDILLKNK